MPKRQPPPIPQVNPNGWFWAVVNSKWNGHTFATLLWQHNDALHIVSFDGRLDNVVNGRWSENKCYLKAIPQNYLRWLADDPVAPNSPGCVIPPHILTKYKLNPEMKID